MTATSTCMSSAVKRLCDDGLVGSDEGALGVGWAMMEFATIAEGRSTMRGQARRAETSDASTVPTNCRALVTTWRRWLDDDSSRSPWWDLSWYRWLKCFVGARFKPKIFLHQWRPGFRLHKLEQRVDSRGDGNGASTFDVRSFRCDSSFEERGFADAFQTVGMGVADSLEWL